jgi:hypothetical protein
MNLVKDNKKQQRVREKEKRRDKRVVGGWGVVNLYCIFRWFLILACSHRSGKDFLVSGI